MLQHAIFMDGTIWLQLYVIILLQSECPHNIYGIPIKNNIFIYFAQNLTKIM